jgi:hypothetical protein
MLMLIKFQCLILICFHVLINKLGIFFINTYASVIITFIRYITVSFRGEDLDYC